MMKLKVVFILLTVAGMAAPSSAASAQANPARGKAIFQQCRVCHTVDADGPPQMGPNLNKVVGRAVASAKGFNYSVAMAKQSGKWTRERLDAYLAAPARAVPGNKMAYGGLRDPADRRDVIAYLATVK